MGTFGRLEPKFLHFFDDCKVYNISLEVSALQFENSKELRKWNWILIGAIVLSFILLFRGGRGGEASRNNSGKSDKPDQPTRPDDGRKLSVRVLKRLTLTQFRLRKNI